MSEEEIQIEDNTSAQEDRDRPTAPLETPVSEPEKVPGKWQMPEPVFQKTSGYLPQGFLKEISHSGMQTVQPAVPSEEPSPQASFGPESEPTMPATSAEMPVAEIIEQPDISEQFPEPEIVETNIQASQGSGGAKLIMLIVGAVGLLIFALLFLIVIYLLFFAKGPSVTGFQP